MNLLAHITDAGDGRVEQGLKEHCLHTGEYAARGIGSVGLCHTAYLAGILHDAGKAKTEFVDYIEKAYQGEKVDRGSVNHTFAGVIWILERYHTDTSSIWEKLASETIGYAVGSHHGMFDCVDLNGGNGFLYRLKKDKKEIFYQEAMHNYFTHVLEEDVLDWIFQRSVQEIKLFFQSVKETYSKDSKSVFFQISMLVRLILSAVIYGDRRDTSEFMGGKGNADIRESMGGEEYQYPGGRKDTDTSVWQSAKVGDHRADWKRRREYFEQKIERLRKDSPINCVRNAISNQCMEAAGREPGIYRLNVPTGGGKTLCTLRYALAHAEKYNKKRIIFIIPLLSILDQNVKVIKDFVPDEREVLEHHSNVVREREMNGEELDHYEYLTDSWNYPIVVSTLVQLLNILFSHQTSAVGRLQALCDSVIVIDEVQSLPKKVTAMFNMAMNFLCQFCNATIVLSSATQPCFEELKWSLRLAKEPDLVRLNQEQLQVFKRAAVIDHTDKYGMDWEECAVFCNEIMERQDSLLIICNTKSEARRLFEKLKERSEDLDWDIYHLSTAMCQEHRWNVIEEMKESLRKVQHSAMDGEETLKGDGACKRGGDLKGACLRKVVCVSTQLIEAGVDISFASVVRVMAGLDNLAQAAGRCNRSNEYGREGKVYLIKLKNENLSMLPEIKKAQDSTRKELDTRKSLDTGDGWEGGLLDEASIQRFYRYLFKETEKEIRYPIQDCGRTIYLADLLSNKNDDAEQGVNKSKNEAYVLRQPFKTAGKNFRVFAQDTTDILVPYGDGAQIAGQLKMMQDEWFDFGKFKEIMRQAKKYTISIYEWQKEKLYRAGLLSAVLDGRALVLDEKAYDECFGLTVVEEQAVDNYIL